MTPERELLREVRGELCIIASYHDDPETPSGVMLMAKAYVKLIDKIDALLALPATVRSGLPDAWLEIDHGQVIGVSIEKDLRSPFKWVPLYASPLSETAPSGTAKVQELIARVQGYRDALKQSVGSILSEYAANKIAQQAEDNALRAMLAAAPSPDGNEEPK